MERVSHFPTVPAATLALALLALPAPAEEPIDAAARIAQLRETSQALAALAREPIPESLGAEERSQAEAYRQWLEHSSAEVAALADEWEQNRVTRRSSPAKEAGSAKRPAYDRTGGQAVDRTYESRQLRLQERLNQQSRMYSSISNAQKAHQDRLKAAIQNMR